MTGTSTTKQDLEALGVVEGLPLHFLGSPDPTAPDQFSSDEEKEEERSYQPSEPSRRASGALVVSNKLPGATVKSANVDSAEVLPPSVVGRKGTSVMIESVSQDTDKTSTRRVKRESKCPSTNGSSTRSPVGQVPGSPIAPNLGTSVMMETVSQDTNTTSTGRVSRESQRPSTNRPSTRSPAGQTPRSPIAPDQHELVTAPGSSVVPVHRGMTNTFIRTNDTDDWPSTRTSFIGLCTRKILVPIFMLALVCLVVLGLSLAVILISTIGTENEAHNDRPPTGPTSPPSTPTTPRSTIRTLDSVVTRGTLNCGVVDQQGFSGFNKATGQWEGFEVDLCRAIAATIFEEEDENVNFVQLGNGDRFTALQSTKVDVVAASATFTMQRDVFEPTANAGFTFSTPYLYNGLGFAGQPQYVECAEARNTASGNCSGVKICVQAGTTHLETIQTLFPSFARIVQAPTIQDFYQLFVKGLCNVLAGEQFDLSQKIVNQAGYSGSYKVGQAQYSKEPIALVTRDDDPDWSNLVNWVLLGLLTAENQNIGQSTAASVVTNPSEAIDESQIKFYKAVAKVGNYGEMYQKNLASIVPRASVNSLNNGTQPLLYSIPFGESNVTGPAPISGGTLEKILQRGFLQCGISDAPFFVQFKSTIPQLSGFDVDYCRAISAAIFNGVDKTVFIPVLASERFQKLANGEVDLLSRITSVTYLRNVNESTTNMGYTFAPPVFYTGLQFGGIPEYLGCANGGHKLSELCRTLSICVNNGTTTIDIIRHIFSEGTIIVKKSLREVAECLVTGEANVIAGTGFATANYTIHQFNLTGRYNTDPSLNSRDTFAIVTRQDDPQWSSFVSLVVTATFYAEEQGISQNSANKMPLINLFGASNAYMLQNSIRAVGSYRDIYQRNAGSNYPRLPVNTPNLSPFGPQHFPPTGLFGLR